MDVSEQCGYSIENQFRLFNDIKPLFSNKPIMVIVNKTDQKKICDLDSEKQKLFEELEQDETVLVREMSTRSEEGVIEARNDACDALLAYRVDTKVKNKKTNCILNRLHVAIPTPRDKKVRAPFIPEGAVTRKNRMEVEKRNRKLEKEIEEELGDDYVLDLQKNFLLKNPEEKYDIIPELWEGKNIADYVDPDIMKKLEELEKEEEERELSGFYDIDEGSDDEEMEEIRSLADQIRRKKALLKNESIMVKNSTKSKMGRVSRKRERSVGRIRDTMNELGVEIDDDDLVNARDASAARSRGPPLKKARMDSEGRVRSSSRQPRDQSGIRDPAIQRKSKKIGRKAQKPANRMARKGEGDRTIPNVMPKHLFCGKRKGGKTDRR
jgi:nucleolar GTP-binding protein